jgi:hypothetical protein
VYVCLKREQWVLGVHVLSWRLDRHIWYGEGGA